MTTTTKGQGIVLPRSLPETTRRGLAILELVAQGERDHALRKSVSQVEVFRSLRKRLTSK